MRGKGLDNYVPEPNSGCWLWLGAVSSNGYGNLRIGERRASAHRAMYERERGPIPGGLQLDHLCRVRSCVNPAHLEAVTARENTMRGATLAAAFAAQCACLRGHAFSEANTYRHHGRRHCRVCRRSQKAARRERGFRD